MQAIVWSQIKQLRANKVGGRNPKVFWFRLRSRIQRFRVAVFGETFCRDFPVQETKSITLPPIIMEVENDPIVEETTSSLVGTHSPQNHDYGR